MLCNAVFNIAIGVMNQNKISSTEFTAATEVMPSARRKFGAKDLEDSLSNFRLFPSMECLH